jgi:hypothetical protein
MKSSNFGLESFSKHRATCAGQLITLHVTGQAAKEAAN